MTLCAANDRFAPSNVVDLSTVRHAAVTSKGAMDHDLSDYGYLLTYSGKRRVITNLSTGRKICALAG